MKKSIKKIPPLPAAPCDWDIEDSNNSAIFISLFIVFVISIIVFFSYSYLQNSLNKKAIIIDCKLLNRSYKGSTLETNAVPVVGMGMNGSATVGVGLATSGHSEDFISVFDCGNYGILISNDKEVFRKVKEKENNKLNVYFGKNDYKILNI
jgi:hypothetical protein